MSSVLCKFTKLVPPQSKERADGVFVGEMCRACEAREV